MFEWISILSQISFLISMREVLGFLELTSFFAPSKQDFQILIQQKPYK